MVHGLSGNYFFIIHMNDKHLVLIRKFIIVLYLCSNCLNRAKLILVHTIPTLQMVVPCAFYGAKHACFRHNRRISRHAC
jgi:hypothetical protein